MSFTYSTALKVANQALELSGLYPIPDVPTYINNAAGGLDKYQRQVTLILDLVQRRLGLIMNKRFLTRPFTIKTTAYPTTGQTAYPVPNGVSVEGFKANNFFNVTLTGIFNSRMHVLTHQRWREENPRPDLTAPGIPLFIVPLPDDGSGVPQVMFWPYPSDVYTIEGKSRIIVQPITSGDQFVM